MRAQSEPGSSWAPRRRRGRLVTALPAEHACAQCPVRLQTICGVLEPRQLAAFKALGSSLSAGAGQCLFHEGDAADFVFNLTSGMVKLYTLLPDGRRQLSGFLFPGDFLGIGFGDEHRYTAEAVEPSTYCRIPRQRFETFAAGNPAIERDLYQIAAYELRAAQEQLLLLGRKTAPERLATFLLNLFDRARRRNADWEIVRLPMTRLDIADYLGLTKETVSRTFTALRNARLIRSLPGERVELIDRAALEALAGGY